MEMELGIIKSFDNDRGYGFIQTENKSVFFHISDVSINDKDNIDISQAVMFNEISSPKGFKAKNISVVAKDDICFDLPKEPIIISKGQKLQNEYVVIDKSDYEIFFTATTPTYATKWFSEYLSSLDGTIEANAVVDVVFHRSTGSEPGTGQGTHYFTNYNFFGRIARVGKMSSEGKKYSQLKDLNQAIECLIGKSVFKKQKLENKLENTSVISTIVFFIVSIWFTMFKLNYNLALCFTYSFAASFIFLLVIEFFLSKRRKKGYLNEFIRKYDPIIYK